MTPQQLSERLWHFAARIAKVVDALPETRVGRHVAGQIVRSGIAAAPNYCIVPEITRHILNFC